MHYNRKLEEATDNSSDIQAWDKMREKGKSGGQKCSSEACEDGVQGFWLCLFSHDRCVRGRDYSLWTQLADGIGSNPRVYLRTRFSLPTPDLS